MAERSEKHEVISDDQKTILRGFYERGMTTTCKDRQAVIEEASVATNTSDARVKVSFSFSHL